MSTWSALGGNPVPGDVGAVRHAGTRFGTVGEQAELLVGTLRRIDSGTGTAVWRGPASETFRQLLAEVGPELTGLATSYHAAQSATVAYAVALGAAQEKAQRAAADAQRAQSDRALADKRREQAAADANSCGATKRANELRLIEAAALLITPVALVDAGYNVALRHWEQQVRSQRDHAATRQAEAKGREQAASSAVDEAEFRLALARGLADDAKNDLAGAASTYSARLADAGDASGVPRRGRFHPPIELHGPAPVTLATWPGRKGSKGKSKTWKKGDPIEGGPEFQSLLSASTSVGGALYDRSGTVKGRYGEGQASFQAGGVEASGHADIGPFADGTYGAQAGLSAAVYAARMQASGKLGRDRLNVQGSVHGQVGARADADAGVRFGKGSAGAHAGGKVFIGAEAGTEVTGDIGGVKPRVGASVQAGFGASADIDAGYRNGKLHFGTELGVSFLVGGKVDGSVEIDVSELTHTVSDVGKGATHLVKSIGHFW